MERVIGVKYNELPNGDRIISMSNGESENPSTKNPPWTIRQVIADVRKFSEYVLIPKHRSGKDKIFIDRLGYRSNNLEDAQTLQELYIHKTQTQFLVQHYTLGEGDRYRQRFTIIIKVKGELLLTGWILDSNGTLKLFYFRNVVVKKIS